jgi:hypothetical protein
MKQVERHPRFRRAGLFVAAVLTAAGVAALPARADNASAAPIVQAFQAMFSANSFRIGITGSSSYGKSDASQSTGEMIVVRQGRALAYYMKLTIHQKLLGKTSTNVTEMISTATHTCIRTRQLGTWSCHSATESAFMSGITPDALRKASAQIKQVTPLGSRTVNGQLCRGYRFLVAIEQTTIWTSVATQRPVQLSTSGAQGSKSQPATSMTITETFSNWNDPSLKMPAV